MSFVSLVPEEQAGTDLKPLYQQLREKFGFVPNYFLAQGRIPALVEAQMKMRSEIMGDGALPAALKAQLAMVVSGINTSSYCVAIHLEFLRTFGVDQKIGRKLATDYMNAPVEDKVKALFRFADKLTRKPGEIDAQDVEALRRAGWDEAAIFETVLVVALLNFANRFSLGLGLMADY